MQQSGPPTIRSSSRHSPPQCAWRGGCFSGAPSPRPHPHATGVVRAHSGAQQQAHAQRATDVHVLWDMDNIPRLVRVLAATLHVEPHTCHWRPLSGINGRGAGETHREATPRRTPPGTCDSWPPPSAPCATCGRFPTATLSEGACRVVWSALWLLKRWKPSTSWYPPLQRHLPMSQRVRAHTVHVVRRPNPNSGEGARLRSPCY